MRRDDPEASELAIKAALPAAAARVIDALTPLLSDRRLRRIEASVERRTRSVVVVLEAVQDPRNVAAVLRLNHLEFFWKIMIPSAAPYIFTGLRIGIGLSWLAIVAAEMLTGGVGVGFFIWDAWNSSRLSDIVVALVYIGVVGFILDRIVAGIAVIVTRGTAAN